MSMIPATIIVSILGIVLVASAPPMRALGIMIASMFVYPEYLRIPVGVANMSAPRILGIYILIRMMNPSTLRNFKWRWMDTLVVCQWVWAVLAAMVAGSDPTHTTELVGRIFDTVLIYFVARLCVAASDDYDKLLPPLVLTAVSMAVVGIVEACTSQTPYRWMLQYAVGVQMFDKELDYRYGLLRHQGSMSHSIYFGMAMFVLLGLIYSIRGYCRNKVVVWIGVIAAFLATLSSMSSGPQQAILLFMIFSLLYFTPSLIKPLLVTFIAMAVTMEFASNRHFWYLTEYINIAGGDYWYRAKLIDVAIAQWRDYWLIGMGSNYPSYWGLMIDSREHVDIVDHYIIIAVEAGLLGVFMFVGMEVLAIRQSIRRWKSANLADRKMAFTLGTTLLSLAVAMLSVGMYSVPLLMTYMLVGFMTKEPSKAKKKKGRRRGYRSLVEDVEAQEQPGLHESAIPAVEPDADSV